MTGSAQERFDVAFDRVTARGEYPSGPRLQRELHGKGRWLNGADSQRRLDRFRKDGWTRDPAAPPNSRWRPPATNGSTAPPRPDLGSQIRDAVDKLVVGIRSLFPDGAKGWRSKTPPRGSDRAKR